jgi:NADPH-dependent ferric siderophore reductase
VVVQERTPVTARLARVRLAGAGLVGFPPPAPAASVRVLLPVGAALGPDGALVLPAWAGNEFLLPDGSRPPIRTLTPRRFDPAAGTLDVEVVLHGPGTASSWAATAAPGSPAAVSGPGRGYTFDPAAPAHLLAGDETALPAIATLCEAAPAGPLVVHIELVDPEACPPLPLPPGAVIHRHRAAPGVPPGAALLDALAGADWPPGTRIWAAGEAAAMQRLRTWLFGERGVPRAHAHVRGYWVSGRAAAGLVGA